MPEFPQIPLEKPAIDSILPPLAFVPEDTNTPLQGQILAPIINFGASSKELRSSATPAKGRRYTQPPYSNLGGNNKHRRLPITVHPTDEVNMLDLMDKRYSRAREYIDFSVNYYLKTLSSNSNVASNNGLPITPGLQEFRGAIASINTSYDFESDYNVQDSEQDTSSQTPHEIYILEMQRYFTELARSGDNFFLSCCGSITECEALLCALGGVWVDLEGQSTYITSQTLSSYVRGLDQHTAQNTLEQFFASLSFVEPYCMPSQLL